MLLWDVSRPEAPNRAASLPEFDKPVFACEISDDGRLLATAVGDGSIALWDVTDPVQPVSITRLPGHADIVDTVSFSADGALLISGAGDGRALLWNTADTTTPAHETTIEAGTGPVESMVVTPDGRVAAVFIAPPDSRQPNTGTVRLFGLPDSGPGRLLAELSPSTRGRGLVLSFSPDGRTLLTANHDIGVSHLWNVANPAEPRRLGTIERRGLSVRDAAWNSDGTVLMLSGSFNGEAGAGATTLWDVSDPAKPALLTPKGFGDRTISAAGMSPDGRTVALATGQTLHLWDVTDPGNPRADAGRVASHPAVIRTVAFDPRGSALATGSNDQTVAFWSVPDGLRLAVLDGHEEAASSVVFTADATMISVLDDSGIVTLWDVVNPALAVTLHTIPSEKDNPATSMALGRDGRHVVLGRRTGTVEVWDIGRLRDIVERPVQVACALTGRGLTESEWRTDVPDRPFRRTC